MDTYCLIEIHLTADQVLIIFGLLWVELSTNSGGLVMWKGCLTGIIGLHNFSELFLPFLKIYVGDADDEDVKGESGILV